MQDAGVQAPAARASAGCARSLAAPVVAEAEMVRGDLDHPCELGLGERGVEAVAEELAGDHNGEINTVRGNRNWMPAREGS